MSASGEPRPPSRGRFIVVEGIDGSGTTTQASRLADALRARGREVVLTCEPTSGPVGRLIRQALEKRLSGEEGAPRQLNWTAMALLFAADRADHDAELIRPALAAGKVVISDRYDLSSLAYQSATAPPAFDAVPWIRQLNGRVTRPDLTVVLDVDPDVAATRRKARGGEAELYEADALQRHLAGLYARGEDLVPGDSMTHVPADDAAEAVFERLLAVVVPTLAS